MADFQTKKNIYIWLGIIIFISALFLRSWDNIFHPGLYAEDATHYFSRYYGGERPLGFIFQNPHGYYNLLNNLVAWLTAKLDVRLHALSYLAVAMVFCVITAISLVFSRLYRTKSMLLIVPLCLGLSGMNHIFYYTTLTFQMYVAVVLLLCLLLFPPPQSIPGTVLLYIATVFLIWSGPYSVVAIPLSVSLIILFPEKKRIYLLSWVILWTLVYLQFTSEGMVKIENIFDPVIRKKMLHTMFYDVFFLRTFGQATGIKIFLFLSLIAGIFYSQRRNKEYIKYSIVFMVLIISSITPLFLSEKIFYYKVHKPCNILISQFFWLAFILYTFDTCLFKIKSRFIHVSAIIIIVVFISYDNYIHVDKRKMVLDETASDFLTAIYHAEQLKLEESNQFVILKRTSPGSPFFTAWVPVGNTNPGAGQLLRDEVDLPAGNEFVSNVYYRR